MLRQTLLIALVLLSNTLARAAETVQPRDELVATFSIVAFDPEAREWGVAVQSRVLAVGSIVPFAKAEVGAIATQSYANTSYGPRGLAMLEDGKTAEETLAALLESDEGSALRQVAIVDAKGNIAVHTGEKCNEWAGSEGGEHHCCQGNILAGPEVVAAMSQAYKESNGPLVDRLLAALIAGQEKGGDKRGQQSAAVLVVRQNGGYAGFDDRLVDLRVDDHEEPIKELKRLVDLRLRRK